jgi:hypothetical protein
MCGADNSPPYSAEVKNGRAIPPFPHTSLWGGVSLLKHNNKFTLPSLLPDCYRVMMPRSLVDIYQHIRETRSLHLQGEYAELSIRLHGVTPQKKVIIVVNVVRGPNLRIFTYLQYTV